MSWDFFTKNLCQWCCFYFFLFLSHSKCMSNDIFLITIFFDLLFSVMLNWWFLLSPSLLKAWLYLFLIIYLQFVFLFLFNSLDVCFEFKHYFFPCQFFPFKINEGGRKLSAAQNLENSRGKKSRVISVQNLKGIMTCDGNIELPQSFVISIFLL